MLESESLSQWVSNGNGMQGKNGGELSSAGALLMMSEECWETHFVLRVYNMETYEGLKAFERFCGVCGDLMSMKYVVAHLVHSPHWCEGGQPSFALLYDKKAVLEPIKTSGEVTTQKIQLSSCPNIFAMSINTASPTPFIPDSSELRELNFWAVSDKMCNCAILYNQISSVYIQICHSS